MARRRRRRPPAPARWQAPAPPGCGPARPASHWTTGVGGVTAEILVEIRKTSECGKIHLLMLCLPHATGCAMFLHRLGGLQFIGMTRPCAALCCRVMSRMQRLLMPGCGRLRAFGGSRFNTAQAPVLEWAAFGSYYFLLPRSVLFLAAACCTIAARRLNPTIAARPLSYR